jgi:hypothetical protein
MSTQETSSPPWAVYRCDRIGWMQPPQNEEYVSAHPTASAAMDEANRLKRNDPDHSYVVGSA